MCNGITLTYRRVLHKDTTKRTMSAYRIKKLIPLSGATYTADFRFLSVFCYKRANNFKLSQKSLVAAMGHCDRYLPAASCHGHSDVYSRFALQYCDSAICRGPRQAATVGREDSSHSRPMKQTVVSLMFTGSFQCAIIADVIITKRKRNDNQTLTCC